MASIDGTAVHFLRFDGEDPDALPIVLTHGWPSSFLELTDLARRLATPSQHGGQASDAFTVIVPSLPGYAFSTVALPAARTAHPRGLAPARTTSSGLSGTQPMGATWAPGHSRLAQAHPEAVVGIHLLAIADPVEVEPSSVTQEEQDYLDSVAAWDAQDGAYAHQQMTRPTTLGYGLSDSPGLLAWMVEKYRSWSDCDSVLSRRFSDDFVLTSLPVLVHQHDLHVVSALLRTRPGHAGAGGGGACADRPGGFPPRPQPASSQLGRGVPTSLTRYTHAGAAYFAAHEEPELLGNDLTAFFEPCAERTDAHAAAHGSGARVILAVIPPRTTPKTGGVQTDGEANTTSEDDTSRHPMDGDEATMDLAVG